MRNISLYLTVTSIVLAGCSSTGVVPMDMGSYYIGKKDGSPGLGISLSNKAAVYKEANAFCSGEGRDVKVLREVVKPARPALLGSTELYFKCVQLENAVDSLSNEAVIDDHQK